MKQRYLCIAALSSQVINEEPIEIYEKLNFIQHQYSCSEIVGYKLDNITNEDELLEALKNYIKDSNNDMDKRCKIFDYAIKIISSYDPVLLIYY